jgi:predicted DNA-binding transcriptional regulator YafY
MGTAERRARIMRILCRRRHETISNLAKEFGVSTRTIQRDIEILSLTEPIYTLTGRYEGGVYVTDNFDMSRMYMSNSELSVLQKVALLAENNCICDLNMEELVTLKRIISLYTKPKIRKENN